MSGLRQVVLALLTLSSDGCRSLHRPQHGNIERNTGEKNRDGDGMYMDRGCKEGCEEEEIKNNVAEQRGDN